MPVWNHGKKEHWKEVDPPLGWDPKWPAIFVIASRAVWGDDGQGNLDLHLETHLHGLCNGPEISRRMRAKAHSEKPTLWALVPVGELDYSHLEGNNVVDCLPEGQRELPAGDQALPDVRALDGGKNG